MESCTLAACTLASTSIDVLIAAARQIVRCDWKNIISVSFTPDSEAINSAGCRIDAKCNAGLGLGS